MGLGNLGDLSNLDSATLLQYLPGVRFPAEKEQSPQPLRATEHRRSWCRTSGTQAETVSTAPTRSCRRYKAANRKPEPRSEAVRPIVPIPPVR